MLLLILEGFMHYHADAATAFFVCMVACLTSCMVHASVQAYGRGKKLLFQLGRNGTLMRTVVGYVKRPF